MQLVVVELLTRCLRSLVEGFGRWWRVREELERDLSESTEPINSANDAWTELTD
jgi:hypothetical protein